MQDDEQNDDDYDGPMRSRLTPALVSDPLASGVKWVSWDEVKDEKTKPILIHFDSDDCPHCVILERHVLADRRVQEALKSFVCVKQNTSESTLGFDVRSVPRDVIILRGHVKENTISPRSVEAYLQFLERNL